MKLTINRNRNDNMDDVQTETWDIDYVERDDKDHVTIYATGSQEG